MSSNQEHIDAVEKSVKFIIREALADRDFTKLPDSELEAISELQAYIWQNAGVLGVDRADLHAVTYLPFATFTRAMASNADDWLALYRAMYHNTQALSQMHRDCDDGEENSIEQYLEELHRRLINYLLPRLDTAPHYEIELMELLSFSPATMETRLQPRAASQSTTRLKPRPHGGEDSPVSPDPSASAVNARVGLCPTRTGSPVQILNSKFQILYDSILSRWATAQAPDGSWPGIPVEESLRRLRIFLLDRDQSVPGIDYPHLITAAFRYYSSLAISIADPTASADNARVGVIPTRTASPQQQFPLQGAEGAYPTRTAPDSTNCDCSAGFAGSLYEASLLLDCYSLLPDRAITSLTPRDILLADYPDLTADTIGSARWLVCLLTLKAIVLQAP